jgi:elongation factor 2
VRVVDMVNVILSTYQNEDMGDLLVYPNKGSVAFGSGKECWAFTITKFARVFAIKFKTD